MTCPICHHPFTPVGRRKFCSDACRATAYRQRRHTTPPPDAIPHSQPRQPITIYECDTCGHRALGQQRCPDCNTFINKIGIGGQCPHCDEPTTITELLQT